MALTGGAYHYGNTDEAETNRQLHLWIIGAIGFILMLVMMCGGVYLAQTQRASDLKRQQIVLQTEKSKLSQELAGLTVDTAPSKDISTKDWKKYCDDVRAACFIHPPTWVVSATNNNGQAKVTITDPKKRVEVIYAAPFGGDTGRVTFRTVSLQDTTTPNAKVKIAGGYFVASLLSQPFYTVTNSGAAPTVIGQAFQLDGSSRFTSFNGAGDSLFQARSLSTYETTGDAKTWFSSTESRTALKVLQSLTSK